MKQEYVIRVEGTHPEYDVEDEDLREGLHAEGYLLLAMKDEKSIVQCMMGMSTMDLARLFAKDTEVSSILCQAAAIGEGIRKADKIGKEIDQRISRKKMAGEIAEKMRLEPDDLK